MRELIKRILKRTVDRTLTVISSTRIGYYIEEQYTHRVFEKVATIDHRGVGLKFIAPNALTKARSESFSVKEPETLAWIDQFEPASVLWDVGANVGLYSIYAALKRKCKVIAFEPSVFNLEILVRNIVLNQLSDEITVVPLALTEANSTDKFRMTTTEWGGARSTFGADVNEDGAPIIPMFGYRTVGWRMDDVLAFHGIDAPHYLKIDVDGIEHLVLSGGANVLQQVQQVLIEVNEKFHEQNIGVIRCLSSAGLTKIGQGRGKQYEGTDGFNEIWARV